MGIDLQLVVVNPAVVARIPASVATGVPAPVATRVPASVVIMGTPGSAGLCTWALVVAHLVMVRIARITILGPIAYTLVAVSSVGIVRTVAIARIVVSARILGLPRLEHRHVDRGPV